VLLFDDVELNNVERRYLSRQPFPLSLADDRAFARLDFNDDVQAGSERAMLLRTVARLVDPSFPGISFARAGVGTRIETADVAKDGDTAKSKLVKT